MMRFDRFNLWVVVRVDGVSSKHRELLDWLLSKLRDKHVYKNILSTDNNILTAAMSQRCIKMRHSLCHRTLRVRSSVLERAMRTSGVSGDCMHLSVDSP